jgi:voltage-gated potassium channel
MAGAVAHWIDDGIPSVWLGIYWAVQTVTTVGYGDPTPSGTSGQVIAIVLMLVGTEFIAVITAAVTSIFIERGRAVHEREAAAEDPVPAALKDIRARLERIEASLQAFSS